MFQLIQHIALLLVGAVMAILGGAGVQDLRDISGTWTAELKNGKVFLQVRTSPPNGANSWNGDWNMGQSLAVDEFSGLPAGDERFSAAAVKFELHREAGTLAFDGAFRAGRGAGLFSFNPRAEYAAEMKALGYTEDLPLWRRFQLAVHDVGPKYIKALVAEGYAKLTLDEVQRARNHGVNAEFLQQLKEQGVSATTLEGYIRLHDHGVRAEYVRDLKAAGFDTVAADDLVRLHDHGVRAELIRELKSQGYKTITLEDAVRLKDHGVSPEYIADMKDVGIKDLTLDQLVRLRDHGITPGFVNHVRARGFKDTTAEELVRLKNGGLWK